MCGISLDCHEMWMPARMVARTVFLMRRGRKEGECQQREGWDPDDRKGRGGCRLGVLGSTPQINVCGQLMMHTLTFQKHGYIIAKFDFQKF